MRHNAVLLFGLLVILGPEKLTTNEAAAAVKDVFPSSVVEFGIDLPFFDSDLDGTPDMDVRFVGGPTVVSRRAPESDGTIPTEIVSMNLIGVGEAEGWALRVGFEEDELPPTLGEINQPTVDSWPADSFFDIFFEVDTPYGAFHNDTPLHVVAQLDRIPPSVGTDYEVVFADSSAPWLPLLDEDGGTIANLTILTTGDSGHHLITPEPASFFVWGALAALCMTAGCRHRRRVAAQGGNSHRGISFHNRPR